MDDDDLTPGSDWDIDDDELDRWADEWDEVDRQALGVLREAWPSLGQAVSPPAGLADPDGWLDQLAETISPTEEPATVSEEEASVWAMLHADWLAFVLGLVRRGVGAELTAETALEDLATMEEIEGDPVDPDDVLPSYGLAIEVLAPRWQALGVLDEDRGLTELGRWGLPRALELVWGSSEESAEAAYDTPVRLDPDLEEVAFAILARAPITLEQLRRALASEARVVEARELYEGLMTSVLVHEFDDGRFAYLPALADGVVLTHRLTAAEIELEAIGIDLDLHAWSLLVDEGFALVGGGELRQQFALGGNPMPGEFASAYVGPAGWLSGFEAGESTGTA